MTPQLSAFYLSLSSATKQHPECAGEATGGWSSNGYHQKWAYPCACKLEGSASESAWGLPSIAALPSVLFQIELTLKCGKQEIMHSAALVTTL